MANLSNINNKFLVTTGGNVLIGQTSAVGSSILQVTGNSTFAGHIAVEDGNNFYGANALAASSEDGNYVASFGKSTSGSAKFAGNITVGIGTSTFAGNLVCQSSNANLTISGDTSGNTYYNNSAGDHRWKANGSSVNSMTLSSSLLTVNENATFTGNVLVGSGTIDNPQGWGKILQVQNSGANGASLSVKDSNNEWNLATYNNYFYISDNVEERLTIDVNGNVGIGTNTPGDKLTIEDSGSVVMSIYSTDTGSQSVPKTFINLYGTNTSTVKRLQAQIASAPGHNASNAGELQFFTGDSSAVSQQRMTIREDGNVGIGDTTPEATLTVKKGSEGVYFSAGGDTANGRQLVFTSSNGNGSNGAKHQINALSSNGIIALATANEDRLTVGNTGNVGIGDDSPSYKLSVHKSTAGDYAYFGASTDGSQRGLVLSSADNGIFLGSIHDFDATSSSGQLTFSTGTTEKMRITSGGSVGIGDTNPVSYKLAVNGTVKGDSFSVDGMSSRIFAPSGAVYNGSGAQTGYLIVKLPDFSAAGINNMMTGVIRVFDYAGNESFDVHFAGYWYSGYNWTNCSAWIDSQANVDRNFTVRWGSMPGNDGAGSRPFISIGDSTSTWSYVKFSVINYEPGHSNNQAYKWDSGWNMDVSTTLPGSSLRDTSTTQGNNWARSGQNIYYGSGTGAVGIGDSNPSALANRLTIAASGGTGNVVDISTGSTTNNNVGAIVFRNSVRAYCGQITVNGATGVTSYLSASDYRLKEDLQDFQGLNLVSNIKVYNYKWKSADERTYGVMAHELQEVLPQAVVGEKDHEEMQSVDYSKIVPILVKAIQELKAEIELLKSK